MSLNGLGGGTLPYQSPPSDTGFSSQDVMPRGGSDARLVTQSVGELATARDPEFFVDALEVAFDRSHRDVTVSGDLFVGAAGGGLSRGVDLAGG